MPELVAGVPGDSEKDVCVDSTTSELPTESKYVGQDHASSLDKYNQQLGVENLSLNEEDTSKPSVSDDETTLVNQQNVDELKLTPIQQGRTIVIRENHHMKPKLLCEIRGMPPPEPETNWTVLTQADIDKENLRRRRLPGDSLSKLKSPILAREVKSTDNPDALLAPSVAVYPAPIPKTPSFAEFLKPHNLNTITVDTNGKPLYLFDEDQLERLINERAKNLVARLDGQKVNKSTQT